MTAMMKTRRWGVLCTGIPIWTETVTGILRGKVSGAVPRRWRGMSWKTMGGTAMMKMVQFIQVHRKCVTVRTMTVMVLWMMMTLRLTTQDLQ